MRGAGSVAGGAPSVWLTRPAPHRTLPAMADGGNPEPVQIPWTSLSPEALRGLVEEFVTRDGTDYGVRERSLEERLRDVLRQVERGEVAIVFDPASGSANLVPRRPLRD